MLVTLCVSNAVMSHCVSGPFSLYVIMPVSFTCRFLGRTSLSLSEVINKKHVSPVLKLKGKKGEAIAVSICCL